ncbi:MAG: FAD-binding oxidoreductase [Myxococcales bacterium]|nr:FAD-binding oxidoreductase [Myxococcales bacterium]
MPKIRFDADDLSTEAASEQWLYEVCDRAGSSVPFACKAGACGTCATEVLSGFEALGEQSAREVRTLRAQGLDPARFRLPCLCDVGGDVTFGKSPHAEGGAALQTHEVVVESFRPLNLTVCEVRFFVETPSFDFRPGQYMIFHLPRRSEGKVIRRSYSISTPPSDRRHFEICVRAVAGGFGSNYIHRLRPGRRLRVEGPYGDFLLDGSGDKEILMIATGTGMSPIRSMLTHLLHHRSDRRVRLFFGVRHESDLFYTDLLRGLEAHHPSFEYRLTLSQPSARGWSGHSGRVTDLIDSELTERDAQNTQVYLCGSQAMIESSCQKLRQLGFADEDLFFENFY